MSMEEKVSLAFAKMGLREPFIAAVVGKLPKVIVTDPNTTAATNGSRFIFGEPWIKDNVKTDEELFGLCLHEALHVVWMHMWRRDGRHPAVWNVANDAIINKTIRDMGYSLPTGGVQIDWVTASMDSEEVYNRLMKEGDSDEGNEPADGDGESDAGEGPAEDAGDKPAKKKAEAEHGKGGFNGQGDLEDAESEAQRADMEATIRAAAEMARTCGDVSAIVNRVLGETPKASVNWRDEVRAALTSSARDDFTYRRFSRRFVARGMYLPALHSEAMGGLMIGFDTSGSVSGDDANQIAGEIAGIAADLNPDWVEVVYCDSEISSKQRFERGDTLVLKPTGGGGTRFKPVIDYAIEKNAEGERVAALIYLTDMCGDLGECIEPPFPVVWGNVYGDSDAKAPFGSVVRVVVGA